jgi:hypothetical protein
MLLLVLPILISVASFLFLCVWNCHFILHCSEHFLLAQSLLFYSLLNLLDF